MENILKEEFSSSRLHLAIDAWAERRAKYLGGACFYRPTLKVHTDEVAAESVAQVAELFGCSSEQAKNILGLLKASGKQFILAVVEYGVGDNDEDEWMSEEPDDEEGGVFGIGREEEMLKNENFNWREYLATRKTKWNPFLRNNWGVYRLVYLLSQRGIRLQTQIVFRNGQRRCGMPIQEIPTTAENMIAWAQYVDGVQVRQARFILQYNVFCLVAACI